MATALAAPGAPAPEAWLGQEHLTSYFGRTFVCLVFTADEVPPELHLPGLTVLHVLPAFEQAWQRYGLMQPTSHAMVLVRPDGHVMGRWQTLDKQFLETALSNHGITL